MVSVFLMLLVAGVAMTQAVSDPAQVTLRWLRLGGLIALTLGCVAAAVALMGGQAGLAAWLALPLAPVAVQLTTVQLAMRRTQRVAAAGAFVLATAVCVAPVWSVLLDTATRQGYDASSGPALWQVWPTLAAAAALLGGFLMTMLLGHAYLTAGNEMTQKPFARLVVVLAGGLAVRGALSVVVALLPYWPRLGLGFDQTWTAMLIAARYLVGLAVPGVFTYMTWDCVKRRSNQSATGILYVAGVMVIVGEGCALALWRATGLGF